MADSIPYLLDKITIHKDPGPQRIELGFNFQQSNGDGERPACFFHGIVISQPIDRHTLGDQMIALGQFFKSESWETAFNNPS